MGLNRSNFSLLVMTGGQGCGDGTWLLVWGGNTVSDRGPLYSVLWLTQWARVHCPQCCGLPSGLESTVLSDVVYAVGSSPQS